MRSSIVGVMADRVERIRHADVVVGAVGAFGDHHVRRDAREIRLIGERDQVEHEPDLLVEVLELADRRVRHLDALEVARAGHLHAPLDLANGVEIVRQLRLVAGAEIVAQRLRAVGDHVEDAGVLAAAALSRSAAVSPSPMSWMNTLRGLYSIGSGVFGPAYDVVEA